MSRIIEFTGEQINQLLNEKEIDLGLACRTLHIFTDNNGKQEIIMNYQGDGYKPVIVTLEFEYDETIALTEDDGY